MKPSAALKKLRTLLSKPSRWTKRYYALDKKGGPVSACSSKAVCWCVAGALSRVNDCVVDDKFMKSRDILIQARPKTFVGAFNSIQNYNDAPKTTHHKIVLWLDRAVKLAEKLEAPGRVKRRYPGAKAGRRGR